MGDAADGQTTVASDARPRPDVKGTDNKVPGLNIAGRQTGPVRAAAGRGDAVSRETQQCNSS